MFISIKRKKEIKTAIFRALASFSKEIKVSKHYTEETLRYIVIMELSKLKEYGSIPNKFKTKPQLSCQFVYKKKKSSESDEWRPDIISATFDKNGELIDPIFPVELKINSSDKDFEKCQHYVNEKVGNNVFKLLIMITVGSAWRIMLPMYKSKIKSINNGLILWCSLEEDLNGKPKYVGKWF